MIIKCSTIFFSENVNKVYSFEPQKENFICLQKNILDNKIKNVEMFNFGIGTKEQKIKLGLSITGNYGSFRIIKNENEKFYFQNKTKTKLLTLLVS